MSKHSIPKDKNPPDSLLFQTLLSEGNTEKALELSEKILEESRNLEERDFEAEAWIRMERALLGAIEPANVGNELRWCVDRLASINPGSPLHGLALLNLASWHRNSNERMMALVTLADISSDAGHPVDLIGLSRLESGRILSLIGDLEPAMRHLWMAMRRLSSSEMSAEAVVCAMEWLDIALDDIDPDSPTIPKTSPAFNDKEMLLTARILPSSVSNCTLKFLISNKTFMDIICFYEDQLHPGDHPLQKQMTKLI